MSADASNITFEVTTADEYGQKILAYKAAGDMPDIIYVGPDTVAANVDDGICTAPLVNFAIAVFINCQFSTYFKEFFPCIWICRIGSILQI